MRQRGEEANKSERSVCAKSQSSKYPPKARTQQVRIFIAWPGADHTLCRWKRLPRSLESVIRIHASNPPQPRNNLRTHLVNLSSLSKKSAQKQPRCPLAQIHRFHWATGAEPSIRPIEHAKQKHCIRFVDIIGEPWFHLPKKICNEYENFPFQFQ